MHWDFYTALSVLSGIVLMAAGLGGPVVGTARERLGIFALGAFSAAYGIWVATQVSGFFLFSVAPAALAVAIIIRAVQHVAHKQVPAGPSGTGTTQLAGTSPGTAPAAYPGSHAASPQPAPARPDAPGAAPARRAAASALRTAAPERVRQAVPGTSAAFCPAFCLPGSAGVPAQAGYYLSEALALGWSVADGRPRVPAGEQVLGLWQASARVKVAVGRDLGPAAAGHDVSWVTVLDGTGLVALTGMRVLGIITRGDSLLGTFDQAAASGVALWCLPLRRVSSAVAAPVGRAEGLILSSAQPAGHVTLTDLTAADAAGYPAAGVAPADLAAMINRARAGLP
jgi:hypothetical protein